MCVCVCVCVVGLDRVPKYNARSIWLPSREGAGGRRGRLVGIREARGPDLARICHVASMLGNS